MRRLLFCLLIATGASAQVAVGTITGSTCYTNPVTGWVAYIDVSSGKFLPAVTNVMCPVTEPLHVKPLQTIGFAQGKVVTITANTGPYPPACTTPNGLIISGGKVINAIQPNEMNGPVLYFMSNNASSARIGKLTVPAGVVNAVAGTVVQGDDCLGNPQLPGGLLLENGKPGPCVIPKSMTAAARSAAGLDAEGKTLILVAIVGESGDNGGLYTYDLANLMLGLGAYNAVNFDGGGSTTFYWLADGKTTPPPVSPTLQTLLKNAKFPVNQPNPAQLQFQATPVADLTKPICYCAECPTCGCEVASSTCRHVYASFALTVP